MPMMFIPFGPWRLSDPPFGYRHSRRCKNVIPLSAGGFRPLRGPVVENTNASGSGSGYTNSIHYPQFSPAGTTGFYYFGSTADLCETSGTNVTKTAAGTYATEATAASLTAAPWKFLAWGATGLATNYSSHVQRQTTRGARFADCITSAFKPKAKFISALGQHVVLAHCYIPAGSAGGTGLTAASAHPQLVCWSKTDDETQFSDPATDASWNSDFQKLTDLPGDITGVAKVSEESIVIFKPGGCHIMQRTGDAAIYSFQVLHVGELAGTIFPESVCVVGRDVYYVSTGGALTVMRNLGQPEKLLPDTVFEYVASESKTPGTAIGSGICSTYVQATECVYVLNNSDDTLDKGEVGLCHILAYNIKTGNASLLGGSGDSAGALPAYLSAITTNPFDRTSTWTGDALVGLEGDTSGPRQVSWIDSPSGVTFETWAMKTGRVNLYPDAPSELGLGTNDATILRIRPIYTPYGTETVKPKILVYSDDNPRFASSRTTTLDPEGGTYQLSARGWYTLSPPLTDEWFEFELVGPADSVQTYKSILGLQIEVVPAGRQ